MVANGKQHKPNEPVYSPAPRREELLVLLHLASSNALAAVVHMDEQRAFLSAAYKGSKPVYTRLHKGTDWFRVVVALYGLKTSPREYVYLAEVTRRLK